MAWQTIQRCADYCLIETFRPGFPALSSFENWSIQEHDIPWVITILPHIMQSLKDLIIGIIPTSENLESLGWKRLDIVLSSWFMTNYAHHNAKLDLSVLYSSPNGQLYPVESMFPLSTSLGKDKWCIYVDQGSRVW